jgi:hypothetical protein
LAELHVAHVVEVTGVCALVDRERLEASAGIGGHQRGKAARDRSGEARWQGRRQAGARGDVVGVEQVELRCGLACTEAAAKKQSGGGGRE